MGRYTIDTSKTPPGPYKGPAFAAWLAMVGAANGTSINLNGVANSVSSVNAATTNRWIYDPNGTITGADGGSVKSVNTKYLSFGTPIGGIPDAGAGGGDGGDEPGASGISRPKYSPKSPSHDLPPSTPPSR